MSDFFDDVFTAYCGLRECKKCPLSKETGDCRDLFARKMKAWAEKRDEMTAAETTPPATDTDVGGKSGKDINVPSKLPKWVKVGQWVTRNDCFTVEQVTDIKEGEIAVGYAYGDEAEFYRVFKPVRFRPYSYEEAKGLLGKVLKYNDKLELIVKVENREGEAFLNGCNQWWWSNLPAEPAEIDGLPIGVPEVDEEAMKEGEE